MDKKIALWILILLMPMLAFAQKQRLANNYYNSGEYEKAAKYYGQLMTESNNNKDFYFQRYTDCLIALRQYDEASEVIKKEIKARPEDVQLYVSLGNLYDRLGRPEDAKKEYEKSLKNLDANIDKVDELARAFTNLSMYEYAIQAYEIGSQNKKSESIFAINMANLYNRLGEPEKMIKYYLIGAPRYASNPKSFIRTLNRSVEEENMPELQAQLYEKIQEYPDEIIYPEVLQWTFIDQKQYAKALRQARAMDRKYDDSGEKVMNVGNIAYRDEDYDTAIKAYTYITDNKSINSPYYLSAKRSLLNSKRRKVTQGFDYSKEDLISLQQEYLTFLDEYGRNTQTAPLMVEYADFEALFMNDLPKARSILEEMINFAGVLPQDIAQAKLDLGDYYLMDGERWEATLLYSQVDKDFKEGFLGEEARYRNAKLSYFVGDFEWAQEQFDILKRATTRLISNDAIDNSVFIMDNLNLDTTAVPMELYASSDLLIFQNRFEEAFEKLDSINTLFPEHSLADDILYSKAQIYKKKLQPEKAIEMYNLIIEKFPEEIRCDNAIYELARMYDLQLDQKEKAKELYEKLFIEYDSSTFAIDARKRYRVLRGDEI